MNSLKDDQLITLDFGSGGTKTSQLIDELIRPAFDNPELDAMCDGAILDKTSGRTAFSSDSFVVDPLIFPGGDIGKLSVCGTVNDVSMCGAVPEYLSFSLIIEEGLNIGTLRTVISSAATEARKTGVKIVTGDTKVVGRGKADGLYINTAGIGHVLFEGLGPDMIKPGDSVLISGTAGDHAAAVMLARNELGISSDTLMSDCAPLNEMMKNVCEAGNGCVRVLRDPTRGGVATTLNEFCEGRDFGIVLDHNAVPVRRSVQSVCDLLGLDPLYCACEGKMLCVVSPDHEDAVLAAMHRTPGGEDAAKIGIVSSEHPGCVIIKTALGAGRILGKLSGAQLPRIC